MPFLPRPGRLPNLYERDNRGLQDSGRRGHRLVNRRLQSSLPIQGRAHLPLGCRAGYSAFCMGKAQLSTVITGQTKPATESLAIAAATPGINARSSSRSCFRGSTSVPFKSRNTPRRLISLYCLKNSTPHSRRVGVVFGKSHKGPLRPLGRGQSGLKP